MAFRTTPTAVKGILGENYDVETQTALDPFIQTANVLTDEVVTCATAKSITMSVGLLERIEANLAAHFYGHSDQFYSNRNTEGASGGFQGQTGMSLDSSLYGQTAKILDKSGCLLSLEVGSPRMTASWLGTRPSNQIDYTDRD